MGLFRRTWAHLGELTYNIVVTHVPVRWFRLLVLRLIGASVGKGTTLFRGTTVLEPGNLVIGSGTNIGFRCLLDARAGLTIGNNVVIASDTHFLAGYHDINSPEFTPHLRPTYVEDHAWLASRVTVESGVTIGRGAVATACALVRRDVPAMHVVGGVPARHLSTREVVPTIPVAWHPLGY